MANLGDVTRILKEEGVSDEDIAKFIVNLNNLVAEKMQLEIASVFEEQDAAEIDQMGEDQGIDEVYKRFKEKTGKDVETVRAEVVDGFVTGFLTEYHKQKLREKKE